MCHVAVHVPSAAIVRGETANNRSVPMYSSLADISFVIVPSRNCAAFRTNVSSGVDTKLGNPLVGRARHAAVEASRGTVDLHASMIGDRREELEFPAARTWIVSSCKNLAPTVPSDPGGRHAVNHGSWQAA